MNFDGIKVALTPSEATFIEDACLYSPDGSVADQIKWKLKAGIVDWATTILGPQFDSIQGGGRYATMRFLAELAWQRQGGDEAVEVIEIEFSPEELNAIKYAAKFAVTAAQEQASNIDADHEIISALADIMLPEDAGISALDADDAEILKDQEFAEKLAYIAVGNSVIAAIEAHQNN
jgi:hypothetical protein